MRINGKRRQVGGWDRKDGLPRDSRIYAPGQVTEKKSAGRQCL